MLSECNKSKEIESLRKEIEELKEWVGYKKSCSDEVVKEFKEMIDRVNYEIYDLVTSTVAFEEHTASVAFYPVRPNNMKDFKHHLTVVLTSARKKYPSHELYVHNYSESFDTISFEILCKKKKNQKSSFELADSNANLEKEELNNMRAAVKDLMVELVTKTKNSDKHYRSRIYYPRYQKTIDNFLDALKETLEEIRDLFPSHEIYVEVETADKDRVSFNIICKLKEEKASDEYKVGDKIEIPMGNGETITAYVAGINCEPDVNVPHYCTFIACFGDSKMGKTALHGYAGAKDMQEFLAEKAEKLKEYFGNRLVLRNIKVSSGIDEAPDELFDDRDFVVSDYKDIETYLYLMSETEYLGKQIHSHEYEMHDEKYPIFKDRNIYDLFGRTCVWLRGVSSATRFCGVSSGGYSGGASASSSFAAAALFTIKT